MAEQAEGRRVLAEAVVIATGAGQQWTTAMCGLLLGRSLRGVRSLPGL